MDSGNATRRAARLGDDDSVSYTLVLASGSLLLPRSGEAILGREAPADLVIADDSVSRRHARIIGGSPPEIEDLGSTNGTKLMGRLLAKGERAPLTLGTVVQVGDTVAFVQAGAPSAAAPARPVVPEPRPTGPRLTIAPPMHAPMTGGPSAVVADATMKQLYQLIDVIAPSKLSVLILGETGVGKDVYAETLHARSQRATGPFVRLNCAALPEALLEAELFGYERGAFTGAHQAKPGLFEAADGGTVFLDEIGEMPLVTQAKLLRVLESGETLRIGSLKPKRVDVRFVSATNRDLEALSSLGQFRSDLYFRLNGVSVVIPPLRKRPDDVVPLALRFLHAAGNPSSFDEAATARLISYRWPGNIRELKNVVERAALLAQGGLVSASHLMFGSSLLGQAREAPEPPPPAIPQAQRASTAMPIRDEFAELEKARILEAMEKCGGNQSRAAKMLGISRTTLIKRLEAYGYVRPRKGQDE